MKIEDLYGCQIEVTDLDKAISITAEYKKYRHNDKCFSEFDKRLKAYWKNMHKKLLKLKRETYEQSIEEGGLQNIAHACRRGILS